MKEGRGIVETPGLEGDSASPGSPLCVLRGGGDLATGVAWRLSRAGWPVVVLELPEPLTVRRTVALSTAVTDGEVDVQGMRGVLAPSPDKAVLLACSLAGRGDVAVAVAPELTALASRHANVVVGVAPELTALAPRHANVVVGVAPGLTALASRHADVVVDARLAKRNIDTSMDDAELVVALGPGFTAGVDCHAVVETMRGHHLGRVIWAGSAQPDTGTPAELGGRSADRVLRAPASGEVAWDVEIGQVVAEGQPLGDVSGVEVPAPFAGVVRGAIRSGTTVTAGLKIGDVDPRCDPSACWEISDKSLAVGGGVLEAVLAGRGGSGGTVRS